MSINLIRSQINRKALVVSITPDLALITSLHLHCFKHVTNEGFASDGGKEVQLPAYIYE